VAFAERNAQLANLTETSRVCESDSARCIPRARTRGDYAADIIILLKTRG